MRFKISYIHPVHGKQSVYLSLSNSFYLNHSSQCNWRCLLNKITPTGTQICNFVYYDDKNNEELRLSIAFICDPTPLSCSLYRLELVEGTDTYRKYFYSDLHVAIQQLK